MSVFSVRCCEARVKEKVKAAEGCEVVLIFASLVLDTFFGSHSELTHDQLGPIRKQQHLGSRSAPVRAVHSGHPVCHVGRRYSAASMCT